MIRKTKETDFIDKRIGMKIKAERLAKGWSLQQFGDKLGVSHQQIQKYEKGRNRITVGRLYTISEVFNRPVSYFFEEDANAPTSAHRRICLELMRNFSKIKNPIYQNSICNMVRTFANA